MPRTWRYDWAASRRSLYLGVSTCRNLEPPWSAYLSFFPARDQQAEDGGESCAVLSVQGGIVGAHQDKTNLASSASKSELVASCTRFHDVVNIGESLDAGGRHVAVDIWDLQKKAEAVTDRVRLRSLLPRSRDKQQQ